MQIQLKSNVIAMSSCNLEAGGEVYTAPVEDLAKEVILIDSSIYWDQPERPINVTVENGRIT